MPAAARPANQLVNIILRHTLGAGVALRFRAKYEADCIKSLKPPYLLIGNHTSWWDPFLMSVPIPRPVHFVASDEYFRTPFMRFVFSLVGGIPKTKNTRDTQAVRKMLMLKKAGAVIGVYPEGNRNWDGVTGPIFSSTAKLVRKLAIPVVTVKTTGGTLTQPRWGRHWRKGWMKLSYQVLFTEEDCRTLSEEEILRRMIEGVAHDDLTAVGEVAASDGLPLCFPGRRLAEHLELFLFQCPACGKMDTMVSRDDRFSCTACDLTVRFGEDGRFHAPETMETPARVSSSEEPALPATQWAVPDRVPFTATRDWNRWQCDLLDTQVHLRLAQGEALLHNEGALLETGGRNGRLTRHGMGALTLFGNRLRFEESIPGTMPVSLPLSELTGLNIQYNNRFELYRNGTLFRFSFPHAHLSVWKWHQALLYAGVPGADAGEEPPSAKNSPQGGKTPMTASKGGTPE